MKLELIGNIVFSNTGDYPDFADACIESAEYNGRDMTNEEIEKLQDDFSDFIYEKLCEELF